MFGCLTHTALRQGLAKLTEEFIRGERDLPKFEEARCRLLRKYPAEIYNDAPTELFDEVYKYVRMCDNISQNDNNKRIKNFYEVQIPGSEMDMTVFDYTMKKIRRWIMRYTDTPQYTVVRDWFQEMKDNDGFIFPPKTNDMRNLVNMHKTPLRTAVFNNKPHDVFDILCVGNVRDSAEIDFFINCCFIDHNSECLKLLLAFEKNISCDRILRRLEYPPSDGTLACYWDGKKQDCHSVITQYWMMRNFADLARGKACVAPTGHGFDQNPQSFIRPGDILAVLGTMPREIRRRVFACEKTADVPNPLSGEATACAIMYEFHFPIVQRYNLALDAGDVPANFDFDGMVFACKKSA